jgi:cation diffusion facilitator family transporter
VNLERWQHSHSFGQEHRRRGETRTMIVIAITVVTMLIEVVAGLVFGSMALLADGLHMASHAAALGINALAYVYARRHAHDPRYSFGTGKVNALGGFTGAVLLAVFAIAMGVGSIERLINPVEIAINQAIAVAVLGLIVNGVSVFILGVDEHHHGHPERPEGHEPGHGDAHRHDHGPAGEHAHRPAHPHHHHHHDHNLRSAYLHVLADALTSLLAIVALLAAKYFGTTWMDPVMGLVGTFLVTRWSIGLLRQTGGVLLDRQGHDALCDAIRASIEREHGTYVTDLHVWSVGPNIHAAIVAVVAGDPAPPEHYKALLPEGLGLVHVSVEVHRADRPAVAASPRR